MPKTMIIIENLPFAVLHQPRLPTMLHFSPSHRGVHLQCDLVKV
jgi:hypothetical protein